MDKREITVYRSDRKEGACTAKPFKKFPFCAKM